MKKCTLYIYDVILGNWCSGFDIYTSWMWMSLNWSSSNNRKHGWIVKTLKAFHQDRDLDEPKRTIQENIFIFLEIV